MVLSPEERKMVQMLFNLASSVRRSRRTNPGLARAAADWEIELGRQLNQPALLVAERPAGDQPAIREQGAM